MKIPLLHTKLHITQLRSDLVYRPQFGLLNEGLRGRLTLVSANVTGIYPNSASGFEQAYL